MALKPGQNDVTVTYKDDNTLEYIYYRIVTIFVNNFKFSLAFRNH